MFAILAKYAICKNIIVSYIYWYLKLKMELNHYMNQSILIINFSRYEIEKLKIFFDILGEFNFFEIDILSDLYLIESMLEIDLIMLDLDIPTPDIGLSLLHKIRSYNSMSSTPIIVTSRYNKIDYKTESYKYNVNDYIYKPYNPKRLKNSIISALNILSTDKYMFDSGKIISLSIENYISKEFKSAKRCNQSISIIVLRPIISNHNYKKSDLWYEGICEKIKNTIRSTDTIILNINKDIILILPFTDHAGTKKVVSKVKNRIQLIYGEDFLNKTFYISHSTYPDDGFNFQDLMKKISKNFDDKIALEKLTSLGQNTIDKAMDSYKKFKL